LRSVAERYCVNGHHIADFRAQTITSYLRQVWMWFERNNRTTASPETGCQRRNLTEVCSNVDNVVGMEDASQEGIQLTLVELAEPVHR